MENASKALLIAGGIFLGIITLSILVVLMNNISNIGASQEEKRKAEELAAWNAEWEAYNKGFLRGAEVLTIVNKSIFLLKEDINELSEIGIDSFKIFFNVFLILVGT